MLQPLHRWIWSDAGRRAHKLLRFSETEIDGGRDILRAAELTTDPLLRRLYLLHASDETRHGQLFRRHASAILRQSGNGAAAPFEWGAPAGHGRHSRRLDRSGYRRDAAQRFPDGRHRDGDPDT